MKVTRRSALVGAASAALVRPQLVRAADVPWAITLGGSSALKNSNPAALGFPTSNKCTFSICYRADPPLFGGAPAGQAVLLQVEGSHVSLSVQIANNAAGTQSYISCSMDLNDNNLQQGYLYYQSPDGSLIVDGGWHEIVLTMDCSALIKRAMLDGTLLADVSTKKDVSFNQERSSATQVWVGGLGTNLLNLTADIAQVYLAVGAAPNLGDRSVAGRFWDYSVPMPQKFSGAGAEVISASPEVFPQVNLTGPAPFFNRNGGRANWSLWSRSDSAPFSYVGGVTTAASDPWEQAIGVAVVR